MAWYDRYSTQQNTQQKNASGSGSEWWKRYGEPLKVETPTTQIPQASNIQPVQQPQGGFLGGVRQAFEYAKASLPAMAGRLIGTGSVLVNTDIQRNAKELDDRFFKGQPIVQNTLRSDPALSSLSPKMTVEKITGINFDSLNSKNINNKINTSKIPESGKKLLVNVVNDIEQEKRKVLGNDLRKTVTTIINDKAFPQFEQAEQNRQALVEKYGEQARWSPQWIANEVSFNAPQYVASIGTGLATGLVTKNPALAFAVAGGSAYSQEAGGMYYDAKKAGIDDARASDLANLVGVINAGLELIPLGRFVGKVTGKEASKQVIKRSLASNIRNQILSRALDGTLEGTTEVIQEIVANSAKRTYDKNQDIFVGTAETFVISAILGVIGGGVTDVISSVGSNEGNIVMETENDRGVMREDAEEVSQSLQEDLSDDNKAILTTQEVTEMLADGSLEGLTFGNTLKTINELAIQENKNIEITRNPETGQLDAKLIDPLQVQQIQQQTVQEQELQKQTAQQEEQMAIDKQGLSQKEPLTLDETTESLEATGEDMQLKDSVGGVAEQPYLQRFDDTVGIRQLLGANYDAMRSIAKLSPTTPVEGRMVNKLNSILFDISNRANPQSSLGVPIQKKISSLLDIYDKYVADQKRSDNGGLGKLRDMVNEKDITVREYARAVKAKKIDPTKSAYELEFKKNGSVIFQNTEATPENIAFAFKKLREKAVESFYVVGVSDGKPAFVELVSVGTINSALASRFDILPAVQAQKVDGVYMLHNHPSGSPQPSVDDITITTKIKDSLITNTDAKLLGHIIIDGDEFGLISPFGDVSTKNMPSTLKGGIKSNVPIYEKYLKWNMGSNDNPTVTSPSSALEIVRSVSENWDTQGAVLFLDARSKVIGVEALPEQTTPRQLTEKALLRRSPNVILVNADMKVVPDIVTSFENAEIRLVDVVQQLDTGYYSAHQAGFLSEDNKVSEEASMYLKDQANVDKFKRLLEEERVRSSGKETAEAKQSKVVEDPLIQEARKYKSAEEFIKSQGQPLYHGTNADFDTFDPRKVGTQKTSDWSRVGTYFDPTESGGDYYRREAVKNSDTKADELYKAYEDKAKEFGTKPMYEWLDLGRSSDPTKQAQYKELKAVLKKWEDYRDALDNNVELGRNIEAYLSPDAKVAEYTYQGITDPYLGERLMGQGYDAVKILTPDGKLDEVVVMNTSKIKTKAQLTDIWNKANKSETEKQTRQPVEAPKISRFQERVRQQLLDQDANKYNFDDTEGTYNKIELEKDANNAIKFLEENPEDAVSVALGLTPPPQGQTTNAIAIATMLKAREESNFGLYSEILMSTSLRATKAGQEIVTLRGQFTDHSPENYVNRLLKERMSKLSKSLVTDAEKGGKEVSAKIAEETKRVKKRVKLEQQKIQSAQDIINSLRC